MRSVYLIGWHNIPSDFDYSIINTDEDIEIYHHPVEINNNNIKKIFIQPEPDEILRCYDYLNINRSRFDYILCYDPSKVTGTNTIKMIVGGTWISPDDYNNINIHSKQFKISNLCGTKKMTSAHLMRIQLYLQQQLLSHYPIIFFRVPADGHGSSSGEILPEITHNPFINPKRSDKIQLFKDFQYSIIIENSREYGYFSEKIIDCLITKTIPIYYGCINITDYFNTDGWIILENCDVNEINVKLSNLNIDYYNKYINIIETNYNRAKQYISTSTSTINALNCIPYIHIYNNIDKIIVINLKHRTERLLGFMNEMTTLGLTNKVERLDAVYTPEFGILGCTKSHILALDQIINTNGYNYVLICEDDFRFKDINFTKTYLKLLNDQILHLDFDIISFAANDKWAGDYLTENTDMSFLKKVICIQTTSAYLISKKFASKLKTIFEECVEPLEHTRNKDLYALDIYWKRLQPISKWYITEPILGYQEPGYSDIECKNVIYNC